MDSSSPVVFTNKAHCRDCYRCLRVCPVKAIRMEKGQAYVMPERCIACGTCIRECPQKAKSYRTDAERAARLIASGVSVAVSVAPSFVAAFSKWEQRRLPSALRKLGFSHVAETAIGAYQVAKETARLLKANPSRSHICTACPVVVRYVESYDPERLVQLTPVVSPMIAHARHLKRNLGSNTHVVFAGPCVAKKAEAERSEHRGEVECVLTFQELLEWLEHAGIDLAACEESRFDEEPEGDGRLFPLAGGSLRAALLDTDLLATNNVTATGIEEIRHALAAAGENPGLLVEPLFCPQGCVNGPAMPGERSIYERRSHVLEYAGANSGRNADDAEAAYDLRTRFQVLSIDDGRRVSEDEIRRVLAATGKAGPEDHLNCGACGYPSCREKAIAVVRGMAEVEMCIPYMKRLAERRTDRIIETSPNGIVILDERFNILSMNPAFRKYFMCSDAVCGQRISYLMDPDPFEKLATGQEPVIETVARHERYNLVCHQIHYMLPEERQYVGIFVNITHSRTNKEKLDQLRAQTVLQARELLEHQVHMAQTIAKFLGESTAQGEALVEKLLMLTEDASEKTDKKANQRLWDIYMSK